MNLEPKKLVLALTGAAVLTLAGCGGGGGGSSTSAASASTPVTVSPSLGKFSDGAHVTIKKPDGTQLGTADISGGTGTATINIPASYSGPILIEVTGGQNVTYFDENAPLIPRPFGASDKLRAIAPAVQAAIGVTAATHAAVAAIEVANAGAIPAAISFNTIKAANAKIEAALGISDVLQAPKLVSSTTTSTLNIANLDDKYALQLAGLAKLAINGKTALDVAKDLALDMADDKLDGKVGTKTMTAPAYVASSIVADLKTKITEAVTTFGDADTKAIIANDNSALGTVTTDVTTIAAPSGTNLSDLQKTKAMFAELRTTLNAFANGSQTGFLDTQAKRAGDDLKANVAPKLEKVASRLGMFGMAMSVFQDAQAYTSTNTNGLTLGTNTLTSGTTLGRFQGSHADVWYGRGSYDYCWTDSTGQGSSLTKVTCAHASPDTADHSGNKIKYVFVELTNTGPNQFSYTAIRYNRDIATAVYPNATVNAAYKAKNALLTTSATTVYQLAGSGTVSQTVANGQTTGLSINGSLPSSSGTCVAPNSDSTTRQSPTCPLNQIEIPATGVDTVAINATRAALTAANNYRYTLAGSVRTNALDFDTTGKYTSLSLDTGTQLDMDETAVLTTGSKFVAATLMGTAKTAATQFTGSVTLSAFKVDSKGNNYSPTSMVFNGSMSDTSSGGAGQILTGKLEAGVSNWAAFDSMAADTPQNFAMATLTFTGTVQAPSRPLMKLVLSGTKTGVDTGTVTLNYSYATVSITGTGNMTPSTSTMTLSNQDGIQLAPDAIDKSIIRVTKAGGALGYIQNGSVKYVDGYTESLN